MKYKMVPVEVESGSGSKGVVKLDRALQENLDAMSSEGWRLISTTSEIYVGRTTWIRLFWEHD